MITYKKVGLTVQKNTCANGMFFGLSANLYITNYVFLCFCNLNSLVTNSTFVSSEFLQIYRTFKKMILPSDFSILNVIYLIATVSLLNFHFASVGDSFSTPRSLQYTQWTCLSSELPVWEFSRNRTRNHCLSSLERFQWGTTFPIPYFWILI